MRSAFLALWLTCVLTMGAAAQTADLGRHFDAPPPKAARDLVKRGMDLAGRDSIDEAIATLKKAIVAAPNFLEAHRAYLRIKVSFQGKTDEAKTEYETLLAKEPDNPVYPTALALEIRGKNEMTWYRKTVSLAPDWSWGHYAKAISTLGRSWITINDTLDGKGDQILAELAKAIEINAQVEDFYKVAIFYQEALGRIDDAIGTAEKMAAQPELRAAGLAQLWRLRLAKAKASEAAERSLQTELVQLSRNNRDISLLSSIYQAYANLLKDSANADAVDRQIRRLDPSWYPERGKATSIVTTSTSGIPYAIIAPNHQCAIYEMVKQTVLRRETDWRKTTSRLESLLVLHPNADLKRFIYGILFGTARSAGDVAAMIKYNDRLSEMDPNDPAPSAMIALVLADRKTDLPKALDYARRAESGLTEFHPMTRPPDISTEDFESRFSLEKQKENYRRQRAFVLDAHGWVLCQMGNGREAEAKLRQSVELNRTETSLIHLAEALKQLGQAEEAQRIEVEITDSLLETIRKEFTRKPATDFQLEAIDGRKYRLSDLNGKMVLINFWATWCGPCVGEMPLFLKMYEKYKEQGFEILAISGDDPADRGKVAQFAREHNFSFPVLFDDGVAKLYNVTGYPTSIFIDRQGNIRYRQEGEFESDGRRIAIIINELLK